MRFRFRPSPAMIVACIALFVALGGTAMAVTYVVSSNNQIAPGTISGHKPPTGKHANLIAGTVNGQDVADETLSGRDVLEQSLNGSAHKLVFESPVDASTAPVKLATVGPYTFRASCTSTTHDEVVLRAFANGPAGNAQIMESYTVNDVSDGGHVSRAVSIPANTNTEVTELAGFSGGDGRIAGTAMLRGASTLIQVDYNGVAKHSSGSCLLYGTATKAT
ncbi:MAG: hypothetical protein ACJ75I_03975 [Solirubrobacterales bacterium]